MSPFAVGRIIIHSRGESIPPIDSLISKNRGGQRPVRAKPHAMMPRGTIKPGTVNAKNLMRDVFNCVSDNGPYVS
jgi:hypothetical protein